MDIGVGTGTLLAKALSRRPIKELTLVDANPICLNWAARNIENRSQLKPETRTVDFLSTGDSSSQEARPYDSIAMVYLLHCIAGQQAKRTAVKFAACHLSADGCCFGATLIGQPELGNFAARRLQRHYRKIGIFANADDSLEQIHQWLSAEFARVEIRQVGIAALFRAWHH